MASMLLCCRRARFSFSSRILSKTFTSLTPSHCSPGDKFHSSSVKIISNLHLRLCSTANVKTDKNLLSKLRKSTGFGFSKCREALVLNNNDYSAAEAWLHEQAEKEGWAKATKLQGRAASEGLVSVMVDNEDTNLAAMVEVNCETDFVARSDMFVDLITMVTHAAVGHRKAVVEQNRKLNMFGDSSVHLREVLLTHDLRDLKTKNGTLEELVAKTIGKLGENIKLGRAITMTTESDNVFGSYVHGPFVKNINNCSVGKFGAIVALKPLRTDVNNEQISALSSRLAQHIVGMNPKVISKSATDKPNEGFDESDVLVEQEYLLDGSLTVGELLEREGVKVVDFVRYECGVI
ncbi:elongation factor Ts, mitochondrial-like [Actinia tenebrosa]|uniref:Elongation factor Ts, mitochondrial n=1 Tax=Actinia tenebrosa TaxID=6105 RepID=A0A6P8I722_ACTTE|nr:elongation factor Ts, mitochondrial-like [Actinia tenebrosa]